MTNYINKLVRIYNKAVNCNSRAGHFENNIGFAGKFIRSANTLEKLLFATRFIFVDDVSSLALVNRIIKK